jgi:hypothetical protein
MLGSSNAMKAKICGDGRCRLFTSKLFSKTLNSAINESDPRSIVNDTGFDIMRSKLYENKTSDMQDQDIHFEFVDMIVQTALFHKAIDKSSSSAGPKGAIKDGIEAGTSTLFASTDSLGLTVGAPLVVFGGAGGAVPMNNVVVAPGTTTGEILALVSGALFVNSKPAAAGGAAVAQPDFDSVRTVSANYQLSGANTNFENFCEKLADAIYAKVVSGNVDNAIQKLGTNLNGAGAGLAAEAKKNALKNLSDGLVNAFKAYYDTLKNTQGMDVNKLYADIVMGMDGFKSTVSRSIYDGVIGTVSKYYDTTFSNLDSSNLAKELWDDIYRNWDSLPADVQDFYNTFAVVMQKVNNQWTEVEQRSYASVAGTVESNKANFRINLKNVDCSTSSGCTTVFSKMIPLLPVKDIGDLWYTNAAGKVTKISTGKWKNQSKRDEIRTAGLFLRNIYNNVYRGNSTSISVPYGSGNETLSLPDKYDKSRSLQYFHIDVDKLVRSRLMYVKEQPLGEAPVPESEDKVYDMITKNIWKRDSAGTLIMTKDGVDTPYGPNDENTTKALKASYSCYSTIVNDNGDKEKCRKYIFECLLDSDANGLSKCIDLLKDKDFFTVATEEIVKMQPLIALRTLQKFGFRVNDEYDGELKMNIKKVESVDHWTKSYMTKKFTDKQVTDAISSNSALRDYLSLIVQYVNANPAILNKNVNGSSDESAGNAKASEYANRLGIRQRIDPGKANGLYDMSVMRTNNSTGFYGSTLKKGVLSINPASGLLRSYDGSYQFNFAPGFVTSAQSGGGSVENYLKRVSDGSVSSAGLIKGLLDISLNEMKQHNKSLDENNEKAIRQKIAQMAQIEMELIRQVKYIDTYNDCLDGMGSGGYSTEVLKVEDLKNLVARCNSLYQKHGCEEQSIMKILQALQKITAGVNSPEISEVDGYRNIDTRGL